MAEKSILDQFAEVVDRLSAKTADPVDRVLGIEPTSRDLTVIDPREDGDDYKTARDGTHRVLGTLETAMEDLLGIAQVSQHPRAFEVLGQLAEKLLKANEQLLDLKSKDMKNKGQEKQEDVPDAPKSVTNNTLVLATGADMFDQIRQMVRNKEEA